MKKFVGRGVCRAVAIGSAVWLGKKTTQVVRETAEDKNHELERLERAIESVGVLLSELSEKAKREAGEQEAEIFEIHSMLLHDEDFKGATEEYIKVNSSCAEFAVYEVSQSLAKRFRSMETEYMRAREADILDIAGRLISFLKGEEKEHTQLPQGAVIFADDLTPSETVSLDKSRISAFVTAFGSANSHTAILARSMKIPAVVGVGEQLRDAVRDGDEIIVNGITGEVFISPDDETKDIAKGLLDREKARFIELSTLKGQETVTADGRRIDLFANVGSERELQSAIDADAGGIGLFRSEFLFLGRQNPPTEQEQYELYARVLSRMENKKVIIRTLDIGADKTADYLGLKTEHNPALGLRGVRLCLERKELFVTQLRALFRASVHGSLGIMFPMISSEWELDECFRICENVKHELSAQGDRYSDNIEVGIMIETPAAAVISDRLAAKADFFSIGTNDLTQYTLACDRQNPLVDRFCTPDHEAVMRLIATTCENAHREGIWVGVCGELASDTRACERLLRMGADELSVSPPFVLEIREKIRRVNLSAN